ncbi:MAG: hypothetical protein RLZZ597_1630 [Cyanobacteriota bacterium]|jgi:hypothetical protein
MALLQRGEVSLTRWLAYVPCRGVQAQSRRLSRWLHNRRLNVHRLYKPLIQAALADWAEDRLSLSLDTSLFWDEYCLVRLAVVRGRALPVVWRVLKHRSASVAFDAYREMLYQAAERLPSGVKVVLADRGFVHTDAMTAMTTQLGWHYRIRIKVNGQFWAIVSDEPTTLHTFEEYGLRFDIVALASRRVEAFLDDPSNRWNLQKSEIRSVCALSRLWFLLAVATLYVTAQGVEVVATGKRRWVDPHWFRGNSYFRMGWDWLKTALEQDWPLICHVRFTHNRAPEPAMASRKQHDLRTYRIEFKINTYGYAAD